MFGSGFVHLHCRSYFSLKEGAFPPEALAHRAAELGMPAVALTDRDGLYGAARFVAACRDAGVHPILGVRLTLTDGGAVVLLARTDAGYANLCRLVTAAHMDGERGDPSVTAGEVLRRAEGLVALVGPESPPGRLMLSGRPGAARERLRPWREAFGPWCFVEVRNLLEPESMSEIRRILRLADDAGVPAVLTNAVRHLTAEDAFVADALECMRELAPVSSHHVTRWNAEGHLKPPRAMRGLVADRPDLADATLRIAEACDVDLGLDRVHFPEFPTSPGRSAASVLAERCFAGMQARRAGGPEVRRRLDHELDLIRRMGYSAYFLTVADIVREIQGMGVRVAARGSAAGSLVCYLTGISEVDPIEHGLLFERFLNPLRDELPDIDLDVESARREEVYGRILQRYGEDRCATVCMVDTYRARAAVREVGKALGYPEEEVDRVAKAFPHIGAHRIREAVRDLPELRGSNLDAGQLEMLFRVAERLNGFPRHIAMHPSGIVLSGHDLPDRVPMERSFLGHRMVQADKDDVEALGLLKLDVLGVRMLSAMRHALDEIERATGERVDLDRIPRGDPAAWELIRASDTVGCFQIESPGQRELLQKFQPARFEDLIVDISLFRPGPVKSDMVTPFLRRRHRLEPPVYAHPSLRPALRETHGVIVYHEQVMRVLHAVGGYDLPECDRIRRHLDDDLEAGDLREDFLRRARERGLDPPEAERVWREVASFASFGFCKAHAAAFAVPTYQSAWLKAHHPAAFLAGVLTHEPGMCPRRLILEDARRHDIPILPLDVNRSERDYTIEPIAHPPSWNIPAEQRYGDPPGISQKGRATSWFGIRLGLRDVDGIADAEIDWILEARRDRLFEGVGDLLRRAGVSRPTAERLAHAGALDGTARAGRRDRLFEAMTMETAREEEQLALPLNDGAPPPRLRDYTDAEVVRAELEVLSLDATRHLLSFYAPLLADLGVTRSRDLHRRRGDAWVMVAGVKVASQTPAVRSGQRIIFLTLDDATGPVDVTVFERVQDRVARTVFHGSLLAVWGRLRRTGVRGASIIAEDVWDLAVLSRARAEGRLVEALSRYAGSDRSLPPRKLWHSSGGSAGW
jgi:error-prone DNA polymerase